MKKIKLVIGITLLFIVVGVAAVTTNLIINVSTPIASNQDDFLVYFSDVKADGEHDIFLVKSEKELVFNSEFSAVGDKKVIDYDVTNASKNYDAAVSISCTESNNYLNVTNTFNQKNNLLARSTRTGTLTVELINGVSTEQSYEVKCTITATAVERTSSNNETVPTPVIKEYRTLKTTSLSDTTMFRSSTYKQNIKTITFEDNINIRDNKIEEWDISEEQDNSIIAYVTPNEDDSTYYNLYIQSNKIIAANKDMSYWFCGFSNLDSINGLELLDTSMTTNMSYMFTNTGGDSRNFTLDVSNFDTSNVTNMSAMFAATGSNSTTFTLDVSNFDTSKVTNMSYMFTNAGRNSTTFTLDVSNFDTSNVTDMCGMFWETGYNDTTFTLDVSDFDTSGVTNMAGMFYQTGHNSETFTLDVSNFDTSKVTDMSYMFSEVGYYSTVFKIDLSNFNTSKVTNMTNMFSWTGHSSPAFTLDLGDNFDTSNVTDMSNMFYQTGYNSTVFTLDLGDKFDTSNVTNMSYMFDCTGHNNSTFTLDLGDNFDTSNVIDMHYMFNKTGHKSTVFTLDLGDKFDTSNVTNMGGMFANTGYSSPAFTLDVSDFDTSNVTDMSYMFTFTGYNNPNFTLDVSGFDTSNVTNMSNMFFGTGYNSTRLNTSITIKKPNVTNYSSMFGSVATKTGSQITVNYTSATSSLVDRMIATKSDDSNVVKGVQVD